MNRKAIWTTAATAGLLLLPAMAAAHGVTGSDAAYIRGVQGTAIIPFIYLGAKHMVTGYDHLLFLVGVIFFLYRLKDVFLYVGLFTLGHSLTLLGGVFGGIHANPYVIDAIIGASVVYKAFDNLGGFKTLGRQPNPRGAVLVFGPFHGFGLATKLQDFDLPKDGLLADEQGFLSPRLCRERRPDGAGLPPRGVPARRLCSGRRLIKTGGAVFTMPKAASTPVPHGRNQQCCFGPP
jgi:hypothetical protein